MRLASVSLAVIAFALAVPATAQDRATMSAPQAQPIADTIPSARDVAYPGTMMLDVDATDVTRGIYSVTQTVPVAGPGPVTLLYPEWLPGKHAPRGAIAELAGIRFFAGGKELAWTRDNVDVYAFHLDVPAGADAITATFKFLSPVRRNEGRIVITEDLMNVQWEQVSLYPAGYYTRQIKVRPTITLPAGWQGATALDGASVSTTPKGNRIVYGVTDYETLIDSPMFAGAHYQAYDLGHNVTLNVFADEAKYLKASPKAILDHKRLVDEAVNLFGSRHFDHYEFLFALTDKLGGIGLEHHRSSENSESPEYFTDYEGNDINRGLLPHEFTHSWNGKFRRPAGMWTPDYRTPMRDNLLWVYEGQTSFWDFVLGARSGMQNRETVLGDLAQTAAFYSERPGRAWRSVEDTTHDPIIAARKPRPNSSFSRSEDYYSEGALTWLAADMKIRELTGGKRSLEDFARNFFGIRDGDWGEVTYEFDDVVRELNAIAPYDWASFLDAKLRQPGQPAPLDGITGGGYRLTYVEKPNAYHKKRSAKFGDFYYSLGFNLSPSGTVTSVLWDSPAHDAGFVNDVEILAVNGVAYSKTRLEDAVTAAKDGSSKISLLTKRGDHYETIEIPYTGGLRFPVLEKIGTGPAPLDRLLEPRTWKTTAEKKKKK